MNLNFNGISADFRDYTKILNDVSDDYLLVENSLKEQATFLEEQLKGKAANLFFEGLMVKIERLAKIRAEIDEISESIRKHCIDYENRKEMEIEEEKRKALEKGDYFEYAKLWTKDKLDREYNED